MFVSSSLSPSKHLCFSLLLQHPDVFLIYFFFVVLSAWFFLYVFLYFFLNKGFLNGFFFVYASDAMPSPIESDADTCRERAFFTINLLVRIHFVIDMILVDRTRAMGVLNSLFQVALHLPSWDGHLHGRRVRVYHASVLEVVGPSKGNGAMCCLYKGNCPLWRNFKVVRILKS